MNDGSDELTIQQAQECDKITAVIPVRKGSKRCKNKNVRKFGYETSLLLKKIKTLQQVDEIASVLVTSDCDEMLAIAAKAGASTHKRSALYCDESSDAYTASAFFHHLGKICETETLMHTPCTTPFVSVDTYRKAILAWKNKDPSIDSVNSVVEQKRFMWYDKKPLNYDRANPPKSQDLPEWVSLTFAFSILSKSTACRLCNVVGENPHFMPTNGLEAIDIDDTIDFLAASQIERMGIHTYDDVDMIMRQGRVRRLDCTLRDGGYLNNWDFTDDFVRECYLAVASANFAYCEIGFRTSPGRLSGKGRWCYSSEEDIQRVFSDISLLDTHLAVMAKLGTFSLSDFKPRNESLVQMVRVLVPKCSTINGQKDFSFDDAILTGMRTMVSGLTALGYEVCVNFPCANSITSDEWACILSRLKGLNVHTLYLADTYGGCTALNVTDVLYLLRKCMRQVGVDFNIGFHAHNNQGDALEKTQRAVQAGVTLIDSSITGLGRGAGNLESEVVALRFDDTEHVKHIVADSVLQLFEFIERYILSKQDFLKRPFAIRHPLYVLAGYLDLHPDYVDYLLKCDTSIRTDVTTMVMLDCETRTTNLRNFSTEQIQEALKFTRR
jgi:CMP-N-acetylneuraminic acid synthetase